MKSVTKNGWEVSNELVAIHSAQAEPQEYIGQAPPCSYDGI
jgi:hypothetical protein